ncbi:aspartyl-phosphate phosphatase Spo0E family protein [Clostridioides difficile]
MEKLRENLHKYIDIYGVGSKKTLKISNKLDKLVNIEMKKNNYSEIRNG